MKPAAGRAVEAGIAGDRLAVGLDEIVLGPDHDHAARHSLADVVVCLAGESKLDAVGEEGTKALAGCTTQCEPDRRAQLAASQASRQLGAKGAIGGSDREHAGRARPEFGDLDDHSVLEGRCGLPFHHACRRRG